MIKILTGPIRSHKTTSLHQWVIRRQDCGGVLSPDHQGLRQLYSISKQKSLAWQKEKSNLSTDLHIGKFVFDVNAFEKATEWLDADLVNPNVNYLILDEVGPLELSGKGWDTWLQKALMHSPKKIFILVVREGLVEKVVAHYGIDPYEVVEKEFFQE